MKQWPLLVILFWIGAVILSQLFDLQPNTVVLERILASPDSQAWLGNDDLGRDIFSRLLAGAQVALFVAIAVTSITRPGRSTRR